LRSFEKHLDEFRARGVQVAALSVDSHQESRKLCRDQGYTFLFLSDPNAEVIRRYGVLHAGAGENARDIARPAEFLVDPAGLVRWVNLTDDIRVRARPGIVLQEIDRLQLPTGR
jgi:peroxiredoxin